MDISIDLWQNALRPLCTRYEFSTLEVGVSYKRNACFLKKLLFYVDEMQYFTFSSCLGPPPTSQIVHGEMVSNSMTFSLHEAPAKNRRLKFMLIFNMFFQVFSNFRDQQIEKS